MADENDKKPSADEIVDNMAEEMGVKKKKKKKSSDALDIFGVAPKKKKKKDEPAEEEPAAEEAEEATSDDEPAEEAGEDEGAAEGSDDAEEAAADEDLSEEDEPVEEKPKKKKKSVEGVFNPSDDGGDVPFDVGEDGFLGEDDLGDYEPKGQKGTTTMLVGVIVVLVIALIAVVGSLTDVGKDIQLVLTGQYRAQKLADKKAAEDAFKAEQLAKLPKYGSLLITGSPLYATIKLNGEVQYAPVKDDIYRDIQLQIGVSNFLNLPIKQDHVVEVSAPGFETLTKTIKEPEWQGSKAAYTYNLQASLTPSSPEAKYEFDARMASDVENDYYGKLVIKTKPAGAKVVFNNKPLLNEKGEELFTPIEIEQYWVKGEDGKLEKEPTQIKVDTVPDQGHKLEIFPPEGSGLPKYITQVNRQMWTCNRKTEDEIKKLGEEHPLPMECNYVYEKDLDLNALKAYIDRREAERKKIEAENKKIREIMAKGGASDGAKMSSDDK
jgi:hypothetical protein